MIRTEAGGVGCYFKRDKRDNGETFVKLIDDAPDWLKEAVREAHVSDMPNDWIYAECEAACDAIDDGTLSDEDSIHEYADGRVDVYTRELYRWAADMCLSSTFAAAESDAEDMGELPADTLKRLAQLQYLAIARIARTMLSAAEENQPDE